jgi:hypothetical protein
MPLNLLSSFATFIFMKGTKLQNYDRNGSRAMSTWHSHPVHLMADHSCNLDLDAVIESARYCMIEIALKVA